MAKKKKSTDIRMKIPTDLKLRIRKFRAQMELNCNPLTSDEKAILHLVDRGLEYETLNA